MRTSLLIAQGLAASLMLVLTLVACDGGGGGGVGPSLPEAWIRIDEPQSLTVKAYSIQLTGSAACDTCPHTVEVTSCDAEQPVPPPAINVTWRNRSDGTSGTAYHYIDGVRIEILDACLLIGYAHIWSANVPLTVGDNLIEVTASKVGWESGTAAITITRLPGGVGALKAVPGKQQVTLSWDPVPDATSYNLYWSTSRDITLATGTMIPNVSSPYTQTGLSDSATYYYVVTAVYGGYETSASPVAWATVGWAVESIAATKPSIQHADISIAMGGGRWPHIHYSYDEVIEGIVSVSNYLVTNNSGWGSQLIAHPGYVSADIGLDWAERNHVSYLGIGLTRAFYLSGSWYSEVVDSTGYCDASLVFQPPHDTATKLSMAYWSWPNVSGRQLRYTTNASGAWVSTVVDTFPNSPSPPPACTLGTLSMGVDAAGVAHIAYLGDGPTNSLKYATNQSGIWTVSVLDPAVPTGLSLAVDQTGTVHIVYTSTVGTRYGRNVAGTWSIEDIPINDASHISLAADLTGKVHLSYINGHGEVSYATNSSGEWLEAVIDYSSVPSQPTAIAVDLDGKAHISYFQGNYFGIMLGLGYATNR